MANEQEKLYTLEREGSEINLKIDSSKYVYYPDMENNEIWMQRVISILVEVGHVTTITFSADRNYVYPFEQVKLLNEIRDTYVHLVKEKRITSYYLSKKPTKESALRQATIKYIIDGLLKKDPIGAYVETVREIRRQKILMRSESRQDKVKGYSDFIKILEYIEKTLENTSLIQMVEKKLAGHEIGDRSLYREIFEPMIKPNFMYTRLMAEPPLRGEEVEHYTLKGNIPVAIYKIPDKISYVYHILPEEYQLNENEYIILNKAREILIKYKPKAREFIDPSRMRDVFSNIAYDLVEQIAKSERMKIDFKTIKKLSKILVRLTVGFGLIEILLLDEKIEDIYVNAPAGRVAIIVKHADYGECITNIVVNIKDAEAWASRFRMLSGRALDEANPILDTELILPKIARSRVAIIQGPLSAFGLAYVFRRHREKPWTYPLFIKAGMISPIAAGVLSFLVDGNRSLLIAGTRGTGKTSLLGSTMVEILRNHRIITIEDTLELPTTYMRNLNFNIIPMKVRSALSAESGELSAEDGVRSALRLGDSCLIMGEIRSREAISLYEAMRIGAMANVVAGTIHADSPYGIFDRVVNDLGVPTTSFKATDIAVIVSKIKSPSGLSELRRVVDISEVRKHWTNDPLKEQGFFRLMEYDTRKDMLVPTPQLLEGESEVIKSIASRVKEWVGDWDKIWDNIVLRAQTKKLIVDYSKKAKNNAILESDFTVIANDQFHRIMEDVKQEVGYPEPKEVLRDYELWLKAKVKSMHK